MATTGGPRDVTTETPSISVVVPMFNNGDTIVTTLASILEQSVLPQEIIIVDDGSVDDGVDQVVEMLVTGGATCSSEDGFRWSLDRIAILLARQRNAGPGAARNCGVGLATSTWIAFLDADDLWYPDHLLEIASLINVCPEAHLVGTRHGESSEAGLPPRRPRRLRRREIDYFARASRDIGIIWSSSAAARRATLQALGGFGGFAYGEDLEMWARIALHYPVAVSSRLTSVYVRRSTSLMATMPSQPKPVTGLEQLSPSAQTVSAALASGDHLAHPASLRRYLNGRLASSIRQTLAVGHIAAAKDLANLVLTPARNWLIPFTRATPPAALRLLIRVRRTLLGRRPV